MYKRNFGKFIGIIFSGAIVFSTMEMNVYAEEITYEDDYQIETESALLDESVMSGYVSADFEREISHTVAPMEIESCFVDGKLDLSKLWQGEIRNIRLTKTGYEILDKDNQVLFTGTEAPVLTGNVESMCGNHIFVPQSGETYRMTFDGLHLSFDITSMAFVGEGKGNVILTLAGQNSINGKQNVTSRGAPMFYLEKVTLTGKGDLEVHDSKSTAIFYQAEVDTDSYEGNLVFEKDGTVFYNSNAVRLSTKGNITFIQLGVSSSTDPIINVYSASGSNDFVIEAKNISVKVPNSQEKGNYKLSILSRINVCMNAVDDLVIESAIIYAGSISLSTQNGDIRLLQAGNTGLLKALSNNTTIGSEEGYRIHINSGRDLIIGDDTAFESGFLGCLIEGTAGRLEETLL